MDDAVCLTVSPAYGGDSLLPTTAAFPGIQRSAGAAPFPAALFARVIFGPRDAPRISEYSLLRHRLHGKEPALKLVDIAKVIRSKNAGPTVLTLDLLFNDEAGFKAACVSKALTADAIAKLYSQPAAKVQVLPYPPALAIKIVMPRRIVSGNPGDSDVYGAQQHGPMLAIEL